MKSEVENVTEVKKIIHFEIPWEEVDTHIKQAIRQISRSVRIPGFRPGKAPDSVIRARYAQHIKDDVINHVIPEAYKEAVEENELDVISEPSLHDVMYSEGSPFLFKVTVETRPKVDVQDYKDLELKGEKLAVTDEEVEAVLKSYQERSAELIPVEDAVIEKSHYVNTHVKAIAEADGKKRTVYDDRVLIAVGSEDTHQSFTENLVGKKAGETVDFDVTYPEDYFEKRLAGKTIHYTVEIEKVNEKRLAPIDDEFAKDQGEFASLNEFKEKIRQDIMNLKKADQKSKFKDELLRQIIEKNPFEVPESLVKRETESLMNGYARNIHERGVNLQDIDWKDVQGRLVKQADQNVRGSILLTAIADAENIQVTEEDRERLIRELAEQQRRAPEAVKADLMKENRMEALNNRLRLSKTIDFVLENAKIVE